MLKKKKRQILAFLLTLTVVLSLVWQYEPQIFAGDMTITESENEEVVPADEQMLPEEIQEAGTEETDREVTASTEEKNENIQEPEVQEQTSETTSQEAGGNNDAASGEEAVAEPAQDEAEQQDQASAQSLYVITDPETHFTATYRFYDSDGKTLLNEQILSAGEKLQKPEMKDKEHYRFTGWYTAQEENKGELFDGFGIEEPEMSESKIITLYAHYEEIYYVYYKASADTESKVIYTQTYKDGEEISTSGVPFSAPKYSALVGWSQDPQAENPTDSFVIQKNDMVLYPVIKEARWITFYAQGGTATDPQYVLAGNTTRQPADPKKTGYQFGGWYTEAECTNAFAFGNTLEEDIELYARWIPAQISYTVVYWQQNPDDDGYSFKESRTMTGTTGELTQASADKKYDGFSVSTTNPIRQQTIRGDGATVVHVYYDRNIYKVKFIENYGWSGNGTEITELTIEAKYGANISNLWPSRRYPDKYESIWKVSPSRNDSVYQSGIELMPLNGDTFYEKPSKSGRQYQADYYVEPLTQGDYILHHSDKFKSEGQLKTTKEDYYGIQGFTVKMSGEPHSPKIGTYASQQQGFDGDTIGWKFYYTRNSYTIEFHNGNQAVNTKTYKYEADISSADYTPEPPEDKEGYMFAGWYDNELGAGERYVFAGKTMPANNLILYAKWVPAVYKVSFDLNGAAAEQQESPEAYNEQTVEKDQTAVKPDDPVREGYSFAGWTRDGEPFNFNTQITTDTVLTAQWISEAQYSITYDPNGGLKEDGTPAEAFADSKKYADGASAKVLPVDGTWQAPDENKVFLGWSEQPDGSEMYHPGDQYLMKAKDVTLYAVWGPARKTILKYDYNGGEDSEGNASETVTIDVPNGKYEIDRDGTGLKKFGYYFTGWSTSADGSDGVLLKSGDSIQIDTLEEEKNVLYAQWEKETPIPTGLADDPIPFAAMSLMGAGAAVLLLIPKRRRS